jgi:hypothetical protein
MHTACTRLPSSWYAGNAWTILGKFFFRLGAAPYTVRPWEFGGLVWGAMRYGFCVLFSSG